jgi:hypothetical protein
VATDYYALAFLRNDNEGMQKQVSLAIGKPGYEDELLSTQSETEAYRGRLKQAVDYSQRAVESAQRSGTGEVAPNPAFLIQLVEARAEWRRRHPKP